MKKITKNQWIAIVIALAVLGFLFYGQGIMGFLGLVASNEDAGPDLPTTGVEVRDVVVGTGIEAQPGDRLTVHYVGILPDSRVFDSSLDRNTPFVFTLGAGEVIRGWDEGLEGMQVGGRRQLFIAPDYGYGSNAVGTIPADSTLIFEIELLNIERAEEGAN